jgi:hypothetical protein
VTNDPSELGVVPVVADPGEGIDPEGELDEAVGTGGAWVELSVAKGRG